MFDESVPEPATLQVIIVAKSNMAASMPPEKVIFYAFESHKLWMQNYLFICLFIYLFIYN